MSTTMLVAVRRRLGFANMAFVLAATVLAATVFFTGSMHAQTLSVIYNFTGGQDGAYPVAGLVGDAAGALYGTTKYGGLVKCPGGCGVAFKLDLTGKVKVLHRFAGVLGDGSNPGAGLVRDKAGNLYGSTTLGGNSGLGVVFKVDSANAETIIHSFVGADGAYPSTLIRDAAGNFYGTTIDGGASANGVVFMVNSAGTETVLHSFDGPPIDGVYSFAGLVRDAAGNLYGTTSAGGSSGHGTVFTVDSTGQETVLHSFAGVPADGAFPYTGLIEDQAGNLYGTTSSGGTVNTDCGSSGCGVIFKVDLAGTETVLHRFGGATDGFNHEGVLLRDKEGNLYGTTANGGSLGFGVVFKLDRRGKMTVLHTFAGAPSDGALPFSGLIRDAAGNFYGTTSSGGASGNGVVFKLSP